MSEIFTGDSPWLRYSVAIAADFLGISVRSLRRTMAAGLIPFVAPPFGPATFDRADLIAFRAAHRREIAAAAGGAEVLDLTIAIAKRRVDARRARLEAERKA